MDRTVCYRWHTSLTMQNMIAKVKPWIEWTLASQKENGYFGPDTDYENTIVGIQRNNCGDWWPKMVMLKVMQQYYSATGDKRVIDFMTKYFQYQLKTLPVYPWITGLSGRVIAAATI